MEEAPLAFVERWMKELRCDDTTQRLKELSSELTERAGDLPAFELRRCQRELESAQKQITDASAATVAPKPRFAFKKRVAATTQATESGPASIAPSRPITSTSSVLPTSSAVGASSAATLPPNALSLSARSAAYLSRADLPSQLSAAASQSPAASASQALAISSISASVVNLLPRSDSGEPNLSYSAVYLSGLRDSLVLLPENGRKGSVLVQDCQRCVIILGGHQIRIHDSTDCAFLLVAGSSPIIERCRSLKFAPYPTSLHESTQEQQALPIRLDVQDFDDPFASASRPSDNWRLATNEEVESLDQLVALLSQSANGRRGTNSWQEALEAALQSV